MSVRLEWDNEERSVIRYIFEGQWTWEDYFAARDEAHTHLESAAGLICFIYDVQTNSAPPAFITTTKSVLKHIHPRTGYVVFVLHHLFMKVLYDTFTRVVPYRRQGYTSASSLAEARHKIAQWQSSEQPALY